MVAVGRGVSAQISETPAPWTHTQYVVTRFALGPTHGRTGQGGNEATGPPDGLEW